MWYHANEAPNSPITTTARMTYGTERKGFAAGAVAVVSTVHGVVIVSVSAMVVATKDNTAATRSFMVH